jgi:hypothetical protein
MFHLLSAPRSTSRSLGNTVPINPAGHGPGDGAHRMAYEMMTLNEQTELAEFETRAGR